MIQKNKNISQNIDRLFRQSYGKIVSNLLSVFGPTKLDLVENAVMEAYYKAIKSWPLNGVPDKPQAWLHRTAKNSLIDALRRRKKFSDEEFDFLALQDVSIVDQEIEDPELKLLFLICHPSLKKEDQLVFMLKTLSGFGDHEICHALMQNKATIKKRLLRARSWIKTNCIKFEWPEQEELKSRLGMVHKVLYLLFNEGYYSSHPEHWTRKDLCVEAMRLCKFLVDHELANYETNALMSLMCYHISRYESRLDGSGNIILLQDQDRSTWSKYMINLGHYYLKRSSVKSSAKSVYQVEAFISAQHCMAKDIESTNWPMLKELYEFLYRKGKQTVVLLNLVIVNLFLDDVKEAKTLFESIDSDKLKGDKTTYYMIGIKLYEKLKDQMQIDLMLEQALQSSKGSKESVFVRKKIESLKKK